MTSWSRRLNAADRRPGVPSRPGDKDVLDDAITAGVVDADLAALRALVTVARDHQGFRTRLTVVAEADGTRRDLEVEVTHRESGPRVRLVDGAASDAPAAAEDTGDGPAIVDVLTHTMVETPDIVAVFSSVGHEALWANDAFATRIPVRAEDKIWLVELLDEWSQGHYEVKVLPALVTYGRWRGRLTLLTGDGELSCSVVIVAHRDRRGEVEAVSMVAREEAGGPVGPAADDASAKFAVLVESAAEIILVCAPQGAVQYASPAAARLLGLDESAEPELDLLSLVHPDDRPGSLLDLVRPDEQGVGVPVDLRLEVPGEGQRHLEVIVSDLTDNPVIGGVVLNARDVSARVEATHQLAERAYTDALTGLPNRIRLLDRLDRLAQDDPGAPVAVLMADLDRFEGVNERLGNEAGDEIIKGVAQRLAAAYPAPAVVARHSGDQFVIVLPGLGAEPEALREAGTVRDVIGRSFEVDGGTVELTSSVGVLVGRGFDAEEALLDVGRALAQAKETGRDRVELFRPELAAAAGRRQTLEQHLRHALDNDGVDLHYQPIVDVATRAVVCAEALLRVRDTGGQLLSPAELIEAAESSGLMTRLGSQVLHATAGQLASWSGTPGVPQAMSVNISPRQLSDPDLPKRVHDALASAGVPPEQLWLEITESILISQQPTVDAAISYLRALGVKIGLDDFGAGKSSLGYLKRFPLDFVKIDRSLVSGLGVDEQDTAIVRATVELAHNLGLTVVAVGIETEEQLGILELLGGERAQGYLFSPPVPPEDLPAVAPAG